MWQTPQAGVLNLSKYLNPLNMQVALRTSLGSSLLEVPRSLFPALSGYPGQVTGSLVTTLQQCSHFTESSLLSLPPPGLPPEVSAHPPHAQSRNPSILPCSGRLLILHPEVTRFYLSFLLNNHLWSTFNITASLSALSPVSTLPPLM